MPKIQKWPNVITVSCLVVTAVIEAGQEGLSHAPKVAELLPALDGAWHFVPLGLLIVAGVFAIVGRVHSNKDAEPLTPSVQILTPLNDGDVEVVRTVSGSVFPPNRRVQVLVRAGDGYWYLQGSGGRATVDGSAWSAQCHFGSAELGVGSNYEVVAIADANIKDARMTTLPAEGIRSQFVKVYRKK